MELDCKRALIISRYHDDSANPIYNAYIKGIKSQSKYTYFIDYFNELGAVGKKEFEKNIFNLVNKEKINLIFFIFVSGDSILDPYFIKKLAKNRFIVMIFWDLEQFFEQIDRYYAQLADLVLLPANYEYIYKFRTFGINAIATFSLFDSSKYKMIKMKERDIDVSFVGEVNKSYRKKYIEYIQKEHINIQNYGVGSKNGKISFKKVIKIFNRSKINLSFTGTYDNSVYSFGLIVNNRIKQNKGKPIEIALCGGFVLSEYVPGIEMLFPADCIDTFKTKEEMVEKIKFYLINNSIREKMRLRAYNYAKKEYDCVNAFQKIYTKIKSITPKKEKELILDNIFIKIYTTFHFYYFIEYLQQMRVKLAIEEFKIVIKSKKLLYKDILKYIKYKTIDNLIIVFFNYNKRKNEKIEFFNHLKDYLSKLSQYKIVVFGAGNHTSSLLSWAKKHKIALDICAIADNNVELIGKEIFGKQIISFEQIKNYSNYILISSFAFESEIKEQILASQIKNLKIFTIYNNFYKKDYISGIKKNGKNIIYKYTTIDPYQNFRNILKYK